ncbi:MAG: peptidylprolyl isomerase [Polyangiaceae bacterium]
MKAPLWTKRSRTLLLALPALCAALASGCNDKAVEQASGKKAEPVGGLSAEQASKIVAKVGDRTITLGDFARTLDRMDPFDRLRYQTKERRRELLQEMIDVELLAQEARRRGLDKRPEVDDALRQLYRDSLLAKLRDTLPPPGAIGADEVKAYYEANAARYTEPERRRVSAIVLANKADADAALPLAQGVKTPGEWGELFLSRSITAPKSKGPNDPVDLAGDLGIVGPPGDPKGGNARVPEPVRTAVFAVPAVGQVAPSVVEADGKFYVVRLSGLTAGHTRTLQEADRSIRVAILQQRMADLEKKLDEELRAKFPVTVDDKVIGDMELPKALVDAATQPAYWEKKRDDDDAPPPAPSGSPSAESPGEDNAAKP